MEYETFDRKAKPVYWSSKRILKIKYHYHGDVNIYYLDKRIKYFDYIEQDDRDKVHKWLDDFEKNIKLF